VSALGVEAAERRLVLRVPAQAAQEVEDYLSGHQLSEQYPLVALHPGCTMPARTYPWEMYSEVAQLLVEQLNAVVLITGARAEGELVTRVREHIPSSARERTLAVAGELPFPAFCGLIERANLLITNNTGPMHIAAAVQTPVVALFALTNPPEQWGPWQVAHRQLFHEVACRLCYSRVCPYQQECLRLVSPAMVVQAAGELLAEREREKEESICTHLPG
jgi:ADP-heptose:LPS heptosyltransferase